MASLSIAQMTYLAVDNVTIYMLRNANSVVSFSLILSNSPHFGTALLGSTRRRIQFPLVFRVCAIKESGL